MTHSERIHALLEHKATDRLPVAMWGHFMNLEDRDAEKFTASLINFENKYQFDLVKIMSNSYYLTEDMGNVIRPSMTSEEPAFLLAEKLAIEKPEDWYRLRVPDVHKGALAREIDVAKRLVDYYKGTVPILPTIFSPLMWCVYMYWPMLEQFKVQFTGSGLVPPIEKYIHENEDAIRYGLEVVTETNNRLIDEYIKAGVDGFFFSQPYAHKTWSSPEMFAKYAKQYDLQNLQKTVGKTWFNMLHVCGTNHVNFDLVLDYPVQSYNWDDLLPGNPSLAEVRSKTDKILIGGMDRKEDFLLEPDEAFQRRVLERAADGCKAAGSQYIFGCGCSCHGDALGRFPLMQKTIDEFKL